MCNSIAPLGLCLRNVTMIRRAGDNPAVTGE
jgi:hypothetical protein